MGVPGLAGETKHLLHQPGADPEAPSPRLHQQQPQPRGGGVLAHAEHASGRRAVDLGDPGRFGLRIPVVHVVRDDPGHQRLVRAVPAELLRVHRPVSLHHPAHVARPGGSEQVPARPRRLGERLGDHAHGIQQPPSVIVAQPGQHVAGLFGRLGVQPCHDGAATAGQLDDLTARVRGRTLPGDETVGLEPGQNAAQVTRVDVDRTPQVGHLAGVPLRQLEEQPCLGERVRGVQVLASQQPDHVRVEPVEPAYRGHRSVLRRLGTHVAHRRVRRHRVVSSQFAHAIP